MLPPESREKSVDHADLKPDSTNIPLNGDRLAELGRVDASFESEGAPALLEDEATLPFAAGLPLSPVALQPATGGNAPGFRVSLSDQVQLEDGLQDAAILAYEYDRRRVEWWRLRRLGLIGLPSITLIFLAVGLFTAVLGPSFKNLTSFFLPLGLLFVVISVVFALYCWLTRPQVVSFGRAYRRLVSIPLSQGGITWCDAAVPAPDFHALRDSYFTLYQESHDMGAHATPVAQSSDIGHKKQTLQDLKTLLKPVLPDQAQEVPSPFIPREEAALLDKLRLEPLGWPELSNLSQHSLPLEMQHLNTPVELQRLAQEIESYNGMRAETSQLFNDTVDHVAVATPLHSQITSRMAANFTSVEAEIKQWRDRTGREKNFYASVVDSYQSAGDQVGLGYDRTALRLEEEVQPAIIQMESDADFYRMNIEEHYQEIRQEIESQRDGVLDDLNRDRRELESIIDERSDEHALLQAEFKSFKEQRARLETSTDQRFDALKQHLDDLTRRSYSVPNPPHFRSDYAVEASAGTTEECLQQLAELRAETRLATSAANNALTRFARLQFEPLDELARLETQIRSSTKWQSTAYLGQLINFKQSGQLLALAGEVSEAASVYLDTAADFERLNHRWCALEASIRSLGLAGYASRLQEAQEYLLSLSRVTGSLHSSLLSGAHSPEMARPATFQTIYDLAAGLERELEELTSLAGSLSFTEERLSDLGEELAQLNEQYDRNTAEIEQVQTDASVKLYQLSQKQKQILEKLDSLKAERTRQIRGHIDELAAEKKAILKLHKNGENELSEIAYATDRLLETHISSAERLLAEARQLHKGLETSISGIVRDFEASILPDRYVKTGSELLVPVWYFQFKERPTWSQRVLGFASCHVTMDLEPGAGQNGPDRSSLWKFLNSARPATYYHLVEEPQLTTLVGAHNLDYPAGQIEVSTAQIDKLVAEGWLNRWLAKTLKGALKRHK
ncbi:MAG: hypothetical protein JWP00_138 [Chloroflexi bacterium]|nr:hypothetical protein [Chloroflexota bacterium]